MTRDSEIKYDVTYSETPIIGHLSGMHTVPILDLLNSPATCIQYGLQSSNDGHTLLVVVLEFVNPSQSINYFYYWI